MKLLPRYFLITSDTFFVLHIISYFVRKVVGLFGLVFEVVFSSSCFFSHEDEEHVLKMLLFGASRNASKF